MGKISTVCPRTCACAMLMAPRVRPVYGMAEGCEAIDSFVSLASSAHQSSSTETDESSHTSAMLVAPRVRPVFDVAEGCETIDSFVSSASSAHQSSSTETDESSHTRAMLVAPRVRPVFDVAEGCEAIDSFVSSASSAHQSSSTETDKSSHTSTTEVNSSLTSWFDKLQAPRPSDLARKRKIDSNPPPVGGKQSTSGSSVGKHDPKTVTTIMLQYNKHRICVE